MTARNFKPYRCDLDANGPESVHRAVALAQAFSAEHSLAPVQGAKLAVLVEEAVTNVYEHGGAERGLCGWLALERDPAGVCILLADNGCPFDPRAAEMSDMPNMERGGGAGLAMIRAWAEIADYRREEGFNLLELVLLG
ncbi:ATP-binding protein [Blastomonas sp. SL216]|uniref:ATP-binding protein n=1 Tax=Blastomonas sp. SL216 TaxID=2995169 RepID=UPI002376E476|nr:ATP-binding protein [Blastomonas sp. SL216]